MPQSGLTSASSLHCLLDKMAGRNNLNEQESNAVLEDSWLDPDSPVPGELIRSECEYVWTGEFDLNTL